MPYAAQMSFILDSRLIMSILCFMLCVYVFVHVYAYVYLYMCRITKKLCFIYIYPSNSVYLFTSFITLYFSQRRRQMKMLFKYIYEKKKWINEVHKEIFEAI